ncbi:hypothetical protein EYF80_020822 [Liparis tanakae]|uniref:Uncharacterized protein n=1 Tax=Liparis tanakae TaxID=230148 RepID=A0A4Z2HTT1_9TELE|nr:hypothetical protein EYF80_020822 [Liparis tanakae]
MPGIEPAVSKARLSRPRSSALGGVSGLNQTCLLRLRVRHTLECQVILTGASSCIVLRQAWCESHLPEAGEHWTGSVLPGFGECLVSKGN